MSRTARRHLAALAADLALASVLFGPKVLPASPGRYLAGASADGSIFLWSLGWWAHAAAHGSLVPYAHQVFAPRGMNLAWMTSIPVPGLLMAPVTAAFGVVASFNVLTILAPATAAWTAYLLAHHATRRALPSFAAGLVFGLSPLQTTEMAMGHLNLSLVALVPLAAYLVARLVDGSLGPRAFVPLFAVALAAEAGISTEVVVTMTVVGALAAVLSAALAPSLRPRLRRAALPVVLGYAGAAVLASPLVVVAFAMPHGGVVAGTAGSAAAASAPSLVRLDVATAAAAATPAPWTFPAVLALPLALVLAHLCWTRRRSRVTWALAATGVVAAGLAATGGLLSHVPVLGLAEPQRLTMYAWLLASLGLGVWLADAAPSAVRWSAAAVAVLALLPGVWLGAWTSTLPPAPPALAGAPAPAAGRTVLVLAGPAGDPALDRLGAVQAWQAEEGFSFRLANAYLGPFAPRLPAAVDRFVHGRPLGPAQAAALRAWLRRAGIGAILVPGPSPGELARVRALVQGAPGGTGEIVVLPAPGI